MAKGKGKGSAFERVVCVKLSNWWAGREDVFWRSSMSGGRATVRRRQNKATAGSYGDIAAIDVIGAPLLKVVAIEVKKGYSQDCFHSLLDRDKRAAQQGWESWIQQAVEAHENSGSFSWMIIAERNMRQAVVMFPHKLYQALRDQDCFVDKPRPFVTIITKVRFKYVVDKKKGKFRYEVREFRLCAMKLAAFLEWVEPRDIKRIAKRSCG